MQINLGTNINAAWTKQIVHREGTGGEWTTLYTDGLSVRPRIRFPNLTIGTGPYNPLMSGGEGAFMISLTDGSGAEVLVFDMKKTLAYQPTWTLDLPGVLNCVTDITTWIASTSSVATIASGLISSAPSSALAAAPLQFRTMSLVNVAQAVKASPGNVLGWNIINLTNAVRYVKFYNLAAGSVVVGTTPVIETVRIPALGTYHIPVGAAQLPYFSTAIAVAAVTGFADSNTAAPAANTLIAQIKYF